MASSASRACLPVASTNMVEPGPAPSIIRPMMESPATEVPSLMTLMEASKHSAVRTKRAEARACRPLRLTMVSCWATALPAWPAPSIGSGSTQDGIGDGDIFPARLLGQGHRLLHAHFAADAPELDQHGQIDPGDHL